MKNMIGDNIRKYRKALGLTQEQLAEAVGVTVGAVSKWESKLSNPDISLIIELADLFGISTDVLLGYEQHSHNLKNIIENLKLLSRDKKYEEGMKEAEKALKKFPNNFDIAYRSALIYSLKCFEQKDQKSGYKALDIFNRSLELINQNTDDEISEQTIQNRMTEVYITLGDNDTALERLKRYNAEGINSGKIGLLLTRNFDRHEEALPYLYASLVDTLTNFIHVTLGFVNCYNHMGKNHTALEILEWVRNTFIWLKPDDHVSYFDKIETLLLTGQTLIYTELRQYDQAERCLRSACERASIFDAAPDFSFSRLKFYNAGEKYYAADDFGETAMQGIKTQLSNDHNSEILLKMLERIQHEHQ